MRIKRIGQVEKSGEIDCGDIPTDAIGYFLNAAGDSGSGIIFNIVLTLDKGKHSKAIPYKCLVSIPAAEDMLIFQRSTPINIVPYLTHSYYSGETRIPFLTLTNNHVAYFIFRNFFYQIAEDFPADNSEELAILHLKKLAYTEDAKVKRLRQEIEALESIINKKHSPKRTPIPDDVKLLVYERDEGKCVRCGSTTKLHFDHIIPFSKGGADSANNIQILCEVCNLQKSDNIAF